MKILVTGFTPFGGESVNPSYEAVQRLPDTVGGAQIIKLEIPTAFDRGAQAVKAAVERYAPDIVLSVGLAGGRSCVTVEKVAINYADADLPDNDGFQPRDETLVPGGPDAYFATAPVNAMIEAVRAHGLACKISYSAGAYVCNSVMYRTLNLAAETRPEMRVGFLHVPYSSEQLAGRGVDQPSLPLDDITRALLCAVAAAAQSFTALK